MVETSIAFPNDLTADFRCDSLPSGLPRTGVNLMKSEGSSRSMHSEPSFIGLGSVIGVNRIKSFGRSYSIFSDFSICLLLATVFGVNLIKSCGKSKAIPSVELDCFLAN